jgi:hypothetical protein
MSTIVTRQLLGHVQARVAYSFFVRYGLRCLRHGGTALTWLLACQVKSKIRHPAGPESPSPMKRFGIFRRFSDGSRAFVTTSEDESSAKITALLLKEETGSDHLVFNLKSKIKHSTRGSTTDT